ncbi:hypothetical protein A5724_19310 [Mycobacterium sp. ACS1612]|uniref:phage tail sheath subtilisin-like domain-containing protein n=1 Tax=Mycobacterium sp. ACS1612 TaxID=1834117 RepID=UPI0008000625|nr:phage tail sheath subtilisin-like domain-containing protein [Mycobacterium sp. ACS1612]OBF33700.1 hypothetical protein A5724_19310 [Mycobacterium sp. ACS1612]
MPEYLAPGVYVEEVDTGAKPIEGVSTSTCAMVGVAERGPVNVPILVTSVGEYVRLYGGQLRAGDDYYGDHRFLPHAIEGFFTNGGKRVYVVRVVHDAATNAESPLFDRGDAASVTTTLLRAAGEGTGSAAAPPSLIVVSSAALGNGDWVRIGDGSTAEYRQAAGASAVADVVVATDLPLARSHPAGESAEEYARVAGPAFTLEVAPEARDTAVVVQGASNDVAGLAPGTVLEIGAAGSAEYRLVRDTSAITVVSGTDSTARVRLDAPLVSAYEDGTAVTSIDLTAAAVQTSTITSATAGSPVFYVDDTQGNLDDRTHLVVVGNTATREVRRIGQLDSLDVSPGALDDYEAGSLVEAVEFAAARTLSAGALAGAHELVLQPDQAAGLVAGQQLIVNPTAPQTVTIQAIGADNATLTVTELASAANVNDEVVPAPKQTTADAAAGARVLAVDDRVGLTTGALLRVGGGAGQQVVTVLSLPAQSGVTPDAGNVVVTPPLATAMPDGTAVTILGEASRIGGRQFTALVLGVGAGASEFLVSDGDAFAGTETIRVTTLGGDVSFHTLNQNAAPAAPEELTLTTALARSHPSGSAVVQRAPLFTVQALDAGSWGNRLRVSVIDDNPGLVSHTTIDAIVNATTIRLASRSGVQPGTVLEISDPTTGAVLGDPVKVREVDRATGNIRLAGAGLSAQQNVSGNGVRSREFTLEVLLLRQPDPATPSRDAQVIDREIFRNLSLDPRHSNYIEKVIGDIDGAKRRWDHRAEGASLYIRVRDAATTAAVTETTRLGPETLVDPQPDGRRLPARLALETVLGGDAILSLTDNNYLGSDNADPEKRTGLQAVRNIEEVSLVAIPGRVEQRLQQGVIDHCELMRYRFAVLDSAPEPNDTIVDAQNQRQQFDTKYAALYYPWLTIPDPYPANLADVRAYPIPPSGHVLGVYARTDIDRGVHKAPANEVVRGITGLRRKVNKEQQDILNPYPVNVNVIRDFRDNNRGIRVYGGRVITSDPDWKYVNVRRLLIFIEASIDRGLQWVVFEPNSEPLWARVRRTITNFLLVVWRNGALEGTVPEEAFFVRCDRTTMTQTDIDNGRLIVQVGVAPVKPAEFVIVRIGLWTARSDS